MGGNKGPIIVIIAIAAVLLAAVIIYKTATRSSGYGDENKQQLSTALSQGNATPQVDNSGKRGERPNTMPLPASKGGRRQ